ncbi:MULTISPECIES: hypothetical protein [unclassified Streptomyces]|uniref:hypothetical protein n=1 Tax=unclassified Streptomyces TaxID=2593676 RepID=UPI0032468FF8
MALQDGVDGAESRSRRRRRWPWITGGIVVGLIVIGTVTGGGKKDGDAKNPTPSSAAGEPSKSADSSKSVSAAKPKAKPVAETVLSESGSGIKSTAKFKVDGDWDLRYSYDCSAFGMQGNFIVQEGGNPLGAIYLNELGKSGADVTHLHDGGTRFLEINSTCSWKISVIDVP